ncbi:MAG: helix-turn-helix domain-containing protein [Acidimicrobiales bacterium]
MSEDSMNQLWAGLDVEDKEYLVRQFVLTSREARELLNVSSARVSKLVHDAKLVPVKRDSSATLFLRDDVEKRAEELAGLRAKYLPGK